jgi:hypothetical protein
MAAPGDSLDADELQVVGFFALHFQAQFDGFPNLNH